MSDLGDYLGRGSPQTPGSSVMSDPNDYVSERSLPDQGSTSLTLLDKLKRGDLDAWDRMVSLYYPLVYGWCRPKVLQTQDAEDVVQEVFRAVNADLKNFRRKR